MVEAVLDHAQSSLTARWMYIQDHDGWRCYSQDRGRNHAWPSRDRAAHLKASLLQHHSWEDFGAENPFILIFHALPKTWEMGERFQRMHTTPGAGPHDEGSGRISPNQFCDGPVGIFFLKKNHNKL